MNLNYTPLIYDSKYQCNNVLLIDSTVEDYQTIVNSVNSNTMAIVYSYLSTKEDLSNVLSNFTFINRIGLAFNSNSNNYHVIFLDNQPFFTNDINNNENVSFIIDIINKYNILNIDFLACNTLNYDNWKNYYNILNINTPVIIGASDNTTGNIRYGGDWILESTSQDIENIYFTKNIEYYTYLLDNTNWISGLSSPTGITSYNYNLYVGTYFGTSITKIPINLNGTAGTATTWYTSTSNLYSVCYYNGFIYTSFQPDGTYNIIQIPINANGTAGTANTSWITNITAPYTIVGYNSYLFTSGNNDGIKQITINANNSAGSIITWYNIGVTSITIYNSIMYGTLKSTNGIIAIPINANGTAGTATTYTTSINLYGIASYNSYLYTNTYTLNGTTYIIQYPINANGTLGTANTTWRTSSNDYMLTVAQNPSGTYSLYETHVNGQTISEYDLSGTVVNPIITIGSNPTGIYSGIIDICNNFSSITMTTNPTINGVSFFTGYYASVGNINYDLSQLYYINQTLNLTPNTNTMYYSMYNSSYYDLSTFFNVSIISNVSNTSNTSNTSNVSNTSSPPYTPPNFLNTSKIMFAVSVRLVIIPYTGPIMKIRKSTTNVTQDFYSDASQTYLTTGLNNTGTSYNTWIGGATGYVTILYDQSGHSNHVINSNNDTTQPFLTLNSGKYVLRFNTGLFTALATTTGCRPNTVFSHFTNENTNYGSLICGYGTISGTFTNFDYDVRFSGGNGLNTTTGNTNDWYYSASGTKLAYNNGVSATTLNGIGNWNLLALSVQSSPWTGVYKSVTYPLYFGSIGVNGFQPTRGLTGYFSEMICHNTMMSSSDMINFYNNRLF